MNSISSQIRLSILVLTSLFSVSCMAAPVLQEHTIKIDGKQRRYFHLSNTAAAHSGPAILLVSGSGCDDFSVRLSMFFERYSTAVNVYYLEKPGVIKNADGSKCSKEFQAADKFDQRLSDHIKFLEQEPELKKMPARSIAVLGFSEGGAVAPYIARDSKKIGWLATAGSGGLKQSEEFLIFADRGVEPYAKPFSRDYFLHIYAEIMKDGKSLSKEFFGHPYAYWSGRLFTDPLSVYASLDIPMVAAMGEKDDSVPIESGHALRDYFLKHPEKDFHFVEFPGASHGLKTPDRNGAQEFVAGLEGWFKGDKKAFELK
ncbi:alpha/beta hydrolase family protein [Undibacterium pigrum]|uniref:Dienelactone hydrolase family protein n=1 Tax=Undibacterium pigrum TaxID=401470 RepID=A0A318J4S1_9BURK|nr:alpha/beta hydrolase [Undibacterium pigrum]PXX42403.1 dienelactone hydrolase family protein [Undibacterium pigrum]